MKYTQIALFKGKVMIQNLFELPLMFH
jgi:hypothetical protein